MSNFQGLPKRTKAPCNLLVVICRRHRAFSQGVKAEGVNGVEKLHQAQDSVNAARRFADYSVQGSLEVQVLEPLTKDELSQKLELQQLAIVYFAGEIDPSRQEIGPLVLGDSELCSADDIASLFKGKLPNLVCLEMSSSIKLGEELWFKGVSNVIVWRASLTATSTTLFRQVFFHALQREKRRKKIVSNILSTCSVLCYRQDEKRRLRSILGESSSWMSSLLSSSSLFLFYLLSSFVPFQFSFLVEC